MRKPPRVYVLGSSHFMHEMVACSVKLKVHYSHILSSDAILFVNAEKNGKKNYVGGNVLIEMGQSYVNDKPIFLLYDLPKDSPYIDEIESMDPIPLHGKLENIKQYLPLD